MEKINKVIMEVMGMPLRFEKNTAWKDYEPEGDLE